MGSGAKPKFDKIPTQAIVNIYAWLGNIDDATNQIDKIIGKLHESPDNPELWKELEVEKDRLKFRTIGLQNELNRLIASQNKGK